MPLRFSYGRLSFEEVRMFLMETDDVFPTPLSAHVDIDTYAKKLSEYSDFAICRVGEDIVGMISCYTNQPPLGYISNVCIKKQWQGQKIFSKLFHILLNNLENRGIHRLRLEVTPENDNALRIYEHFGFKVVEIRPDNHKSVIELEID